MVAPFPEQHDSPYGPKLQAYIDEVRSDAEDALDGKADASALATVATSGAYSDLTGTPSIPDAGSVSFALHGGGGDIEASDVAMVRMNFAGTFTGWDVYSQQSGSIILTVGRATHAAYPTFTAISGSAKPTLASATKAQSTTLTGWTTAFSAGDIIRVSVDSATGVEDVVISLRYTRTV